jgi:peptide chain release factor 2
MRERKRLEETYASDQELQRRSEDISAFFELVREGESVSDDLQREVDALRKVLDELETRTLLSGEHDALNAILTIHPGAGGTESQEVAGLGGDAAPHVSALGRDAGL